MCYNKIPDGYGQTPGVPRLTMKFLGVTICSTFASVDNEFLGVTICSTTLSAMCYLFYYAECSFLMVSFFFIFQLLLSLNVLNCDIDDV
jgi:hypothetical protein